MDDAVLVPIQTTSKGSAWFSILAIQLIMRATVNLRSKSLSPTPEVGNFCFWLLSVVAFWPKQGAGTEKETIWVALFCGCTTPQGKLFCFVDAPHDKANGAKEELDC